MQKTSQICYASLEYECPEDCQKGTPVCSGTQQYLDLFAQVQVEPFDSYTPKVRGWAWSRGAGSRLRTCGQARGHGGLRSPGQHGLCSRARVQPSTCNP